MGMNGSMWWRGVREDGRGCLLLFLLTVSTHTKSVHQEKKEKKRTHQGGKKKNPSRKVRLLTVYANVHIYTHAHVIMSIFFCVCVHVRQDTLALHRTPHTHRVRRVRGCVRRVDPHTRSQSRLQFVWTHTSLEWREYTGVHVEVHPHIPSRINWFEDKHNPHTTHTP